MHMHCLYCVFLHLLYTSTYCGSELMFNYSKLKRIDFNIILLGSNAEWSRESEDAGKLGGWMGCDELALVLESSLFCPKHILSSILIIFDMYNFIFWLFMVLYGHGVLIWICLEIWPHWLLFYILSWV